MMRKVWVIQRPKFGDNFDMAALEALGEVSYMLPAAPNIHDQSRITSDVKDMARIIRDAGPEDVFTSLGGSPLSQMMFGSAFFVSERQRILFGLYSRGRDNDGRRGGQRGSYRLVPVDLYAELPETPQLATTGQGAPQ